MVLQQGLTSPRRIASESVRNCTVEAIMIKFDDYREEYSHIRVERQDGILQITFHTEGAALKRSGPLRAQLGYAFADIARDKEE
jgi:hypothetical protein